MRSVVIDVTDIARSQPPFPEGAIGLRAEILTNDTGTPQQNFPINPRRCFPLGIIKDEKLGVDRDANRADFRCPGGSKLEHIVDAVSVRP